MKPYRKEPRFVSLIAVYVDGFESLIDMMRYDACFPSTEAESHKIVHLASGSATPEEHVVRLTRVARNDAPPTEGRWRSFGGVVLDHRSPDAAPLTDEDLAGLLRHHEATQGRR